MQHCPLASEMTKTVRTQACVQTTAVFHRSIKRKNVIQHNSS
jgi:hypothetical protein